MPVTLPFSLKESILYTNSCFGEHHENIISCLKETEFRNAVVIYILKQNAVVDKSPGSLEACLQEAGKFSNIILFLETEVHY